MQFALFGAGRVGWVHAQNIANHPDAKLSHVYDVDGSASRRMVAALGGKVAETPEEIWTADAVDAVLVASSTNTHIDLLRGAMRAGKAVYCEKPIDVDLAKARTFAVEARDAVAPIFVGFRRRFLPELQAIRQRILGGDIGPVEVVHMMARDFQPPPLAYVKVSGGFVRDKAIQPPQATDRRRCPSFERRTPFHTVARLMNRASARSTQVYRHGLNKLTCPVPAREFVGLA